MGSSGALEREPGSEELQVLSNVDVCFLSSFERRRNRLRSHAEWYSGGM